MIMFIRQKMQGIVFKIFLMFIFIALAGFITLPRLMKEGPEGQQWVVEVNGEKVSQMEFQRQVDTTMGQLQQQFGSYAQTILSQLKLDIASLAINSLIQSALIEKVASKLKIYVDTDTVMQKIMQTVPPQALDSSGRIDQQLFLSLFPMYANFADFEKSIEDLLHRDVVMDIVRGGFYISESDKKQQYALDYLGKKYAILIFPLEKYIAQEKSKQLSEKELEAFYKQENKNDTRYWTPEKRSSTVWEFTPTGFGINIQEKTLESYYNKNKRKEFVQAPTQLKVRHILFNIGKDDNEAQVRQKAAEVLQQLQKDPTLFAQLAKKHSADKDASTGGVTSFFSHGEKDSAFEKAAFRLRKKDEISDLVRTAQGFEIIQRVDRKQESYKPFEQEKASIKKMLESKRFKDEFERTARRLIGKAQENEAFKEFIGKKGAKEKTFKNQERDNSKLSAKLFTLSQGRYGYYIDGDKGAIVRLDMITKSELKSFDSIKKQVADDLVHSRAQKLLKDQLKKARTKAAKSSLDELKKEFGISVEQTGWVVNSTAKKDILLKKLPIPAQALPGGQQGALGEYIADSNGYLILLEQIKPFDKAQFDEVQQQLKRDIYQDKMPLFEAGFVASLARNATINYNQRSNLRDVKRAL